MTPLEELEEELKGEAVEVWHNADLPERLKGLYRTGMIVLNRSLSTSAEKICVLAEEAAHHDLTVGDITDQSVTENRKQELKAHKHAADRLVTPDLLYSAFLAGCRDRFSIADHIGVTEPFLDEALHFLSLRYPDGFSTRSYYMVFDPLNIMRFYN